MKDIKIIVAGTNAQGIPDILVCYQAFNEGDVTTGAHIKKAEEMALQHGFKRPFVTFDKSTQESIAKTVCHLDCPIPFSFDDNYEGRNKIVSGEFLINQQGVTLQVNGFSDANSDDDEGTLVMMEFYDDELVLNAWSDISEEDATHRISFNNAANINRTSTK